MSQDDEAPIPLESGDEEELTPLPLAEEAPSAPGQTSSKIRAFGAVAVGAGKKEKAYQRQPSLTGAGAVRCRMFHSKISVASLEHLIESINEWLDGEEIEVKHVGELVGVMEGKTPEPNLIVMIWY